MISWMYPLSPSATAWANAAAPQTRSASVSAIPAAVARQNSVTRIHSGPVLPYPPLGDTVKGMAEQHLHQSHPSIVKRLKRAEGHLRSITAMIADGRSCLDVAQQLHAVEKAVTQAKKTLIQDHIDHCLEQATGAQAKQRQSSIQEFREITKYL